MLYTLFALVDRTEITRPGPDGDFNFNWWLLLFIPVWILGCYFTDYVKKNKYKKFN